MPTAAENLPVYRAELVIQQIDESGKYVLKDPRSGRFFEFREAECFLLRQLDGQQNAPQVCEAFESRFGESLTQEELNEFVQLVRRRGLVRESNEMRTDESSGAQPAHRKQSILYWRKRLVDPDRLLTKIEPFLSIFWTPAFAMFSALCIIVATTILWTHWHDFASDFQHVLHWKTVAIVWISLLGITACHELAHGLTCKHYGGEVHEIGFLMMFFLPGMYCNVSDAWLFPERRKRLLVTLAGGYFELFLWSLSVFLWRLTAQDELINYVTFIIATVTGTRVLSNFNPLLKLDGYYLLSDLTGITNLRGRAIQYLKGNVRWLLWGGTRPRREMKGRFLLGFGAASWVFSIFILSVIGLAFYGYLNARWDTRSAAAIVTCLGLIATRPMFRGFSQGEIRRMLRSRTLRTAAWLALAAGLIAVLSLVEMPDRVGGSCQLRPLIRTEIRAPVAGFLKKVRYDEGDEIGPASLIAQLEVPDLDSRIARTGAEIAESQAKLRLLQVGARPEEIAEQRMRVERAKTWRDLAESELQQRKIELNELLAQDDALIARRQSELEFAKVELERMERLHTKQAVSASQLDSARKRRDVCQNQLLEARAQNRSRKAASLIAYETELVRRENELDEARSNLKLLEAGTRPEEIDAERARLQRLREEADYLKSVADRLRIHSPDEPSVLITPRVREKLGSYFEEGDLILELENSSTMQVEIALPEKNARRLKPEQKVEIKLRNLPFETFHAQVTRIAPISVHKEETVQGTVTVYCQLDNRAGRLRSGMTGYARIYRDTKPIGQILIERAVGFLRSEFWW